MRPAPMSVVPSDEVPEPPSLAGGAGITTTVESQQAVSSQPGWGKSCGRQPSRSLPCPLSPSPMQSIFPLCSSSRLSPGPPLGVPSWGLPLVDVVVELEVVLLRVVLDDERALRALADDGAQYCADATRPSRRPGHGT
jgi:hypothetical protein